MYRKTMHTSVMDFVTRILLKEDVSGKRVLEVGSRAINGSIRESVAALSPREYVGIDILPGKCVDVVMKAEDLVKRYSRERFDLVLCIETLEHIEFWKQAVIACKEVLSPDGIMLFTTRSPGFPLHAHPSDFWRFTVDDFERVFRDMEILSLESDPMAGHPGVFLKARRPTAFSLADISSVSVRSVG